MNVGRMDSNSYQENRRQAHELSPPNLQGLVTLLHLITLFVLSSSAANADVYVSAGSIDDGLGKLRVLISEIHESSDLSKRISAIFALGQEATALADFLSREVAAHGQQEKKLLDKAIEGAAELGAAITWSGDHNRFFYDGAAFREYLELAPLGPHAADCWFRIIEHQFYFSESLDRGSLMVGVTRKRNFLQNFPEHGETGKVGIYLSIDYRDLWRHCRDSGDRQCATRYLNLTREQLQMIASDYKNTSSGEIAARMLKRIEMESSHDS